MGSPALAISMLFLGLVLGGALGWCLTWFYAKAQRAELEARRDADAEKIEWIKDSQKALRETFEALASKSLRQNAHDFSGRINRNLTAHAQQIDVLKTTLETNVNQNLTSHAQYIDVVKVALETNVKQNLTSHAQQIDVVKVALETNIKQLDRDIRLLEHKREGAYQSLHQQILQLEKSHSFLLQTTQQLLAALKSGPVRGRWGEIQLRKIVELAGMSEHVSFFEQAAGDTGGKPDIAVHLPNEGHIPIDSKFPLHAFLEGIETIDDEVRRVKFGEHARAMRETVRELSRKSYWKQFDPSPELTIMFIPIESCLMIAYEQDPEIIEFALEQKVILASPVTLLGFLKSIAYGWQQFTINKNARKILAQGKELYSRVEIWMEHFRKTGERISAASKSYNDSVASLQSRFLPACRRFQELTAIAEEITDVEPVNIGINLPSPREKNIEPLKKPEADLTAKPKKPLRVPKELPTPPQEEKLEEFLKEAGSPYPPEEYISSEELEEQHGLSDRWQPVTELASAPAPKGKTEEPPPETSSELPPPLKKVGDKITGPWLDAQGRPIEYEEA